MSDRCAELKLKLDAILAEAKAINTMLAYVHPDKENEVGQLNEARRRLALIGGARVRCTCPGWCHFNPGHHHANCTCEASEHIFQAFEKCDLEVWKKIPTCPGYAASTFGRIRSLPRISEISGRRLSGRVMKPSSTKKKGQWFAVTIYLTSGRVKRGVAEIVLETFGPQRPRKSAVAAHRDGNPANCRLDNLFWGVQTLHDLRRFKPADTLAAESSVV